MQKERLLRLASLLEKDAANEKGVQFDLGQWGYSEDDMKVDCGTQACAIGLACLSGEFKDEGLTYMRSGCYIGPRYDNSSHWDAVSKFFDISMEMCSWLFAVDSYVVTEGAAAELEVASRIRYLVEHGDYRRE